MLHKQSCRCHFLFANSLDHPIDSFVKTVCIFFVIPYRLRRRLSYIVEAKIRQPPKAKPGPNPTRKPCNARLDPMLQ